MGTLYRANGPQSSPFLILHFAPLCVEEGQSYSQLWRGGRPPAIQGRATATPFQIPPTPHPPLSVDSGRNAPQRKRPTQCPMPTSHTPTQLPDITPRAETHSATPPLPLQRVTVDGLSPAMCSAGARQHWLTYSSFVLTAIPRTSFPQRLTPALIPRLWFCL